MRNDPWRADALLTAPLESLPGRGLASANWCGGWWPQLSPLLLREVNWVPVRPGRGSHGLCKLNQNRGVNLGGSRRGLRDRARTEGDQVDKGVLFTFPKAKRRKGPSERTRTHLEMFGELVR